MKVGDKIKVEVELEVMMVPEATSGKVCFKFADTMVDISKDGEKLGSVYGAIGGGYFCDIKGKGMGTSMVLRPDVFWDAVCRTVGREDLI